MQVALSLQRAWDSGNRLVSLLDDGSWKALAELEPHFGLQVGEGADESSARGWPKGGREAWMVSRTFGGEAGKAPAAGWAEGWMLTWRTAARVSGACLSQVVTEVVEAMNNQQIRNCNAFLIVSCAGWWGRP